jgi:virginiamycin B lyase
MSQFTKANGHLAQISVASATVAWAVNAKGDVYQYGFGIGCLKDAWVSRPGNLSQISAGSETNVWGVNSIGNVYMFNEKSGWELKLKQDELPLPSGIAGVAYGVAGVAAAASDGTLCAMISLENVTFPAAPPSFFNLVYKWSGSAFELISSPDQVLQLSVGSADNIWGLTPPNAEGCGILRYTGKGNWKTIGPTFLVSISAAADTVWGLDSSGNIYRYPGNDSAPWEKIPGTLAEISAGSSKNVWGLDSAGNVYTYNGHSNSFDLIDGTYEDVYAAADGTVWALTAAGIPYLYSAQNPGGPGTGLGSYANYILCAAGASTDSQSCASLRGVQVTIEVSTALVGSSGGFSFQLNANSQGKLKDGSAPKIVWQQYFIVVGSKNMLFGINNWTTKGLATNSPLINPTGTPPLPILGSHPLPTMPEGYKLTVALENDPKDNINGVTFTVVDNKGNTHVQKIGPFTLVTGGPATEADLAPIVSFELDIVGPGNGNCTEFSSGAGTITYNASIALTPLDQIPPCAVANTTTGETSNSVYGSLPSAQSKTFTQCFGVNTSVKCPQIQPHRGLVMPPDAK